VIIGGATLLAYPKLFSDADAIRTFARENYQSIVVIVAAAGGVLTAVIVAPRATLEISQSILPTYAFSETLSSIFTKLTGSKSNNELEDTVRRFEESFSKAVVARQPEVVSEDTIFLNSLARLAKEQDRLRKNALANLIWGVAFSIGGLAVLGYPVLVPAVAPAADWTAFAIGYLPRGALGLLIALIAFFFLRLYAANESDLRHNKNEISTFESKMIAVKLVSTGAKGVLSRDVIQALAVNERNFVLRRGERTTGAEIDRTYNDIREIIRDLLKVTKVASEKSV
jgi:hypothetical protein